MKFLGLLACFGAIAALTLAGSGSELLHQFGDGCRGDRQGASDPLMQMFDKDDDQQLSVDELESAASMMEQLDLNGDGFLSRDELTQGARRGGRQQKRDDEVLGHQRFATDFANVKSGSVVLHGGFQTDERDGGRPVALIAAALSVEEDVFRDAFRQVQPARGGAPSAAKARQNKKILMDALSPMGVTDDLLNQVSNYYRYRPEAGEMWPVHQAILTSQIQDGKVLSIRVVEPGAGYLTAPEVVVAGYPDLKFKVNLKFSEDLAINGSIDSIDFIQE